MPELGKKAGGGEDDKCTSVTQQAGVLGPTDQGDPQHGEQVAVELISRVGRRNRSLVNVRVVGNSSLTWVDIVFHWGGNLEAVVADNEQLRQLLKSRYHIASMSVASAVSGQVTPPWSMEWFTLFYRQDVGR